MDEKIKEIIALAVQAGKQETSNLVSDIKRELRDNYSKRELDHYFSDLKQDMLDIKEQTIFTNGKVRLHSKILLVVGTAILMLLATSGSEFIQFIKLIL